MESDYRVASGGGCKLPLVGDGGQSVPRQDRRSRNITSARIVDFRGEPIADCPLVDGKAVVEMTPFEWSQVELRWSGMAQ